MGEGDNPYSFALKFSSKFIVTSDSTSMISESAISGKPIYIYQLPFKRASKRFERFHNEFKQLNITRDFKNNIILSSEMINLLIEKSNNDRGNLRNEIEKITSFALNKKNLEIDEIKSLINFSGEYKSDNFINECLCGNILQYKKILSELYSLSI